MKSPETSLRLKGRKQFVSSVAFSPDGATLASAHFDRVIQLWDVESKTVIAILLEHDLTVNSVAFSPDGTLLVSGSRDKTVRVWDIKSKSCIRTMRGHLDWVRCVAFSADSKTVASSGGGEVRLWDVGSGTCLATLGDHAESSYCVTFSPVGDQLAFPSKNHTITIWDAATRVVIARLQGHSGSIHSVAFSPNGKCLASASNDKTVRLWDVVSTSHHSTLRGHSGAVFGVGFSPNGSRLASASGDQTVRVWSLPSQFITPIEPTTIPSSQHAITSQDGASQLPPSSVELKNDITSLISLAGSTLIGDGGFGEVISGTHRDLGKVALKRTKKTFDGGSARRFLREVDLWCSVSHQYILPCLGMCKFEPNVYVVSPFIENGDLHSCMSKGILFGRSKIVYEVAEALAHLHHRGIVHGDVKAQNVLLSSNGSALLCDFGLAKVLDTIVTSTSVKGAGSVRWMAPEIFDNASRSMASDVYSFGITIAEILSGEAPYPGIVEYVAVVTHVLLKRGRPPKSPLMSPDGKSYSILWDAAEKCWAQEAKDRPHMAQVLGMLFPLALERT